MFKKISESEYNKLKEAIPVITLLIASADGQIDDKEKAWASKLTEIRSFAHKEALRNYYLEVDTDFEEKLNEVLKMAPIGQAERSQYFSDILKQMNPILAKLENETAFILYRSFVSFAEHIAKASGGFFRFAAVSKEEKRLISLPMIDEIIREEKDS